MAFVCWRTDDLDTVLSLEALSGQEELFLATHFPIDRLYVKKNSGDFHGTYWNQEELFKALIRDRLHMFCVIEGIAGCGKSHLIRWLKVQWGRQGTKKDVVLLLPRSGRNPGRMVGVLRDELAKLGFDALAGQLVSNDDLTPEGRRESFLDRLATLLDSKNVQHKRAQWDWCDEKKISDVFRAPRVREQWRAPARLIADHEKEELPLFRREEMWQVADLAMRSDGLKKVTIAALSRIKSEGEKQQEFVETDRLLTALNDRSRPALRAALGLNERVISEVFTELRRRLYKSGKRLVILQEDITAAQGIDETLLDLFVSQAGMEGVEECPLVAVCGITPAYEKDYFNQSYGTRVILHVDMTRSGQQEDVPLSVVGTPDRRRRFVARYLNGVRWSAKELREQWTDGDAPPSRCTDCAHRSACHRTFGQEDAYGLYPFTATAIERGFEYLTDRDDPEVAKTPRNVLKGLLQPVLMLKKQVEQNRFPGPEVHSDRLRDAVMDLAPDVDSHIRASSPETYERLRALIGLWGDGGRTRITTIDGEPAYAGVTKDVYGWFDLPWVGDGQEVVVSIPSSQPARKPQSKPSPSRPSELDMHLAELTAWRKDSVIQSQTWWEERIWQIVSEISWADHGIPEWAGRQLLPQPRIKLEGSKVADFFLVVPHEPWATEGLQALVHLHFARENADLARYGQKYLVLVEKITTSAVEVVAARMHSWRDEKGNQWNPLASAIQCLVVHAWVSGRLTPRDSLLKHWHEVLSYPDVPATSQIGRSEAWTKLSQESLGPLQTVHKFVEAWVSLLQGSTGKFAMDEPFEALNQLETFVKSLAVSAPPKDETLGNLQDLSALATAAKYTSKYWQDLVSLESQRLREQAKSIDKYLDRFSLREATKEIHAALDEAYKVRPSVAAHELNEWARAYGRLAHESWWNDQSFEEAVEQWVADSATTPGELLAQCIETSADRFDAVLQMLNYGESALSALEDEFQSILAGDPDDPVRVLADIHKEATAIQQRVHDFQKKVEPIW